MASWGSLRIGASNSATKANGSKGRQSPRSSSHARSNFTEKIMTRPLRRFTSWLGSLQTTAISAERKGNGFDQWKVTKNATVKTPLKPPAGCSCSAYFIVRKETSIARANFSGGRSLSASAIWEKIISLQALCSTNLEDFQTQ